MRTLRHILLMLTLAIVQMAYAQTDSEVTLQELYVAMSDLDDFDEEGWAEAYEMLSMLAENPQNINEVTLEDLKQVPLLSESQAEAIIRYRTLYGELRSMAELSLVESIDRPRLILLNALFYAQKVDGQNRKSGRGEHNKLLLTLSIPAYERAGYKDGSYAGGPLSHSLRYTFTNKHYQAAFTAAQDAGEPFFSGTNKKGWDFYTGFFRMKDTGVLKNLVVGHYQMTLGTGLILNNGYRLSRTSLLTTSPSSATVLRGHASKQQSNYMQGLAATVALPGKTLGRMMSLTAFFSYRPLDATMAIYSEEDMRDNTVTTILTNGYHRTDSEIARRNSTYQTALGGSLSLNIQSFRLSMNVLHVAMRDSLKPFNGQEYRRYYPAGKNFTLGSLGYAYIHPRLEVAGETAVSPKAAGTDGAGGVALATMNSVRWKVGQEWKLFAVQRYYGYRFQSPLGKSFGDVSNVQNENGIYVGVNTTVFPRLSLSAYVDCVYHPWYRYGYEGASRSWDTYLNAIYTHGSLIGTLRYRYREQTVSENGSVFPTYSDDCKGQHTLRSTLKYSHGKWTTMTQLHGTYVPTTKDWGYLLAQGVGYEVAWLSVWASLAYFHTSAYASRLYLSDRNLTYCSTSSMLYGRGLRANCILNFKLKKDVTASVCSNISRYFDRQQVGTGHQMIDGPAQADILMQFGWRF